MVAVKGDAALRAGENHTLWRWWDSLFHRAAGLQPLVPGESHIFYVAKSRYFGKPFTMDDIHVRRFAPIIELHMNNDMLFQALRSSDNPVRVAVWLLRETQRSLPALARAVERSEFREANVLLGITLIHRGIDKFGFRVFPIRNRAFRWLTFLHLRWVFRMVNPDAQSALFSHPDSFVPKIVAMTKSQLQQRYGSL